MFKFNARNRSDSAPARMGARILSASGLSSSKSLSRLDSENPQAGHHEGPSDTFSPPRTQADTSGRSLSDPVSAVKPNSFKLVSSRRVPSVYAAMQPALRSVTAPAAYSHPGSFLGPVCGVATTKTTRQLLELLLQAQTVACVGKPAEQIGAEFDIQQARKALLRRDLKQDPIEDLAHTPIERVFESIMAEELIEHMPFKLLQPMQQLSH